MDKLESELIPLTEVIELESNSKDHDLGSINTSIDRFGFLERIIINRITGHLIAGHGRVRALQQMKADGTNPPKGIEVLDGEWLVPADYVEVKKKEEVAASIALNKLVELGGWDEPKLVDNLISIAGKDGAGLVGTGFDGDELDALIRMYRPELIETPDDPGAQLDKAEELQKKWQVERGQIWEIGRHRLMCGDSTSENDVDLLLDEKTPDLCLTDPPYGVGIDYASYDDTVEELRTLIDKFLPIARRCPIILLTSGSVNQFLYPRPNWVLAWVEPAGTGRGPWGYVCWQPILAYGKDPYLANGKGSRPDTFVGTGEGASNKDHPVAKPLKIWLWLIERGTIKKGTIVFDPFLGSGTTMVAAEQLNRICYGMEIHPPYCAVTLERMSGMGLEPKLAHE